VAAAPTTLAGMSSTLQVGEPTMQLPGDTGATAANRQSVMQSEAYLQGDPKAPGVHGFAFDKLLHEDPDYVVYNGSVGSLTDEQATVASVVKR
jgi:hypothetical protein